MSRGLGTGALLSWLVLAAPRETARPVYPWSAPTGWDVELAAPGEPGPPFEMSGRLFGLDSLPLAGARLYVNHADAAGLYARMAGEFSRIARVVRTNVLGEYRIRSILPGQYAGPRHVHFELWERGAPLRTISVNLRPHPDAPPDTVWRGFVSYLGESVRRNALVTRDSSGVYRSRFDLWLDAMIVLPAAYDSVMRAVRDSVEGLQ